MRSTGDPEAAQTVVAAILAGDREWNDALEDLVACGPFDCGHRSGPRWTDGLDALRVVERGLSHLRVTANI